MMKNNQGGPAKPAPISANAFSLNPLEVAVQEKSMNDGLMDKIAVAVITTGLMLFWTGCTTVGDSPLPEQPTAKTPTTLTAGDVIKITFTGAPDLNQSQKIRADGKVSLPLVGEVTGAGKTILDLQNELIRLYKPQLRNNEIVITLESGIVQVVVSGAVAKPGKLTFDRPTTMFQAIMEAGGVSEYGTLRKVRLIRTISGKQLTQVIDLRPALTDKSSNVLYIKDGDIIYVPQSLF